MTHNLNLTDKILSARPALFLVVYFAAIASAVAIIPDTAPMTPEPRLANAPPRDGRHVFDFTFGRWQTHIWRRTHPLSQSTEWAEYTGTSTVRPIWRGSASLGETEADGAAGHLEALSLRLYNPTSHQWSLSYASSGGTTSNPTSLGVPTVGEFINGRGEFFDVETYAGKSILVRNSWTVSTKTSIRFEQAFSEDIGRTWETNWIAIDTLIDSPRSKHPID